MYKLLLHKTLTPEKWRQYAVDKQLFMIANEINRLINGINFGQSFGELKACMERAFELIDLTIDCQKASLRRELLRWREVFSANYVVSETQLRSRKKNLQQIYRVLLLLNSKTAELL